MRLFQGAAGTTTSRLAYDGLDRIAEYNGSDALQRRYVFDGGGQPIVWYAGATVSSTTRRFLSSDERGSIVSVTNSSGALLGIDTYDEYGMPGSGNLGTFGYTGQAWLPSVGVWYYKARVYSPTLGRFLQTDPIGYGGGGPNLYNYVLGDPVNLIDPLGLEPPIVVTGTRPSTPDGGGGLPGGGGEGGGGAGGFSSVNQIRSPGEQDIVVTGTRLPKPPVVTPVTPPPPSPELCSSAGCIPQSQVNEIVVTGYRLRRLGGVFINFNLTYPQEQLWAIYPDTTVVFIPTKAEDVNGEGKNTGVAPKPGYVATAHTHDVDMSGPGSHRAVYVGG